MLDDFMRGERPAVIREYDLRMYRRLRAIVVVGSVAIAGLLAFLWDALGSH